MREGERYALTSTGHKEAGKDLADMRRTDTLLSKLAQPQTVSQVGLAVHWGLAALKLPRERNQCLRRDMARTYLPAIGRKLMLSARGCCVSPQHKSAQYQRRENVKDQCLEASNPFL